MFVFRRRNLSVNTPIYSKIFVLIEQINISLICHFYFIRELPVVIRAMG